MVKIQETRDGFHITIPKVIVKQKKWAKGIELAPMFNERGNVELMEVKP